MSDGNLAELIAAAADWEAEALKSLVPQETITFTGRYIVNPDPQNSNPQLLSGHWRHVGEFVRFEHVCPGDRCAIARWIRERAQ